MPDALRASYTTPALPALRTRRPLRPVISATCAAKQRLWARVRRHHLIAGAAGGIGSAAQSCRCPAPPTCDGPPS